MRTYVKLTLVGATAAVALGVAVGSASARRIQLSETVWHQVFANLHFSEPAIQQAVVCPVTLEGSFHSRTLSKVCGQLVGYITKATVGNNACAVGHATALTEMLPWHITYESFTGTLPDIEQIKLLYSNVRFRFERPELLFSCLVATTAAKPARGILRTETATSDIKTLRFAMEVKIPTPLCPPPYEETVMFGESEFFAGTNTSTARITVRLIP